MFARIFTKSMILIIFEQWHYCMIKDPTHELSSVRYSSMGLHTSTGWNSTSCDSTSLATSSSEGTVRGDIVCWRRPLPDCPSSSPPSAASSSSSKTTLPRPAPSFATLLSDASSVEHDKCHVSRQQQNTFLLPKT